MKAFQLMTVVASTYLAVCAASPISIESRAQCNAKANPDCLAGYNLQYYNATFDSTPANVNGTTVTTSGPLRLAGWRVASAPVGQPHAFPPPHLTPESGNQYIRAQESSGAFNSTRLSTNSTSFKFKSFFFGCSRYEDFTPIPCTLKIAGYVPVKGKPCPKLAGNATIEYIYGNPGPTGEAPLQQVTTADLAKLGVAHDFVLSTTGPEGEKPRLVLDNVNVATYDAQT